MADDVQPLLGINVIINGEDDEDSSSSDDDDDNDLEEQHIDVEEEKEDDDDNSNGENTDSTRRRLQSITFDTSLPGTHSYLGDDLEDISGRTIYDEDGLVSLPLIKLPGMVLVPGQTIPLTLFHQHVVAMMKEVRDTDKTFGVVAYRFLENEEGSPTTANIGTTAEIFSYKDETDDQTGLSSASLMAKGRQRFKVVESRRTNTGILMAKVKILKERMLPEFLEGARPPSHCKFCCNPVEQDPTEQTAVDREGKVIASVSFVNKRQINRFTSAYYTWWPPWVYKMYDPESVVQRMKQKLNKWNETLQADKLTNDPIELSYWVCQNLPLDDSQRLNLLSLDSAVQRLRCALSIMEKCSVICCRECKTHVALTNDVFSLSLEGPLGAYVNPHGHVHETLTVYKSQNINLMGRPTKEHSWFPGYAWTIAYCRRCTNHMGWKFTATTKNLTPQKFFGLTRGSVTPGMQQAEELTDGETWMPTM
ncbi:protein cereblon-like [Mytilus californianus]|uniref:protein cereblon-like n=1 Tax=Mytilus californianus TaxID=6549 RepID=UPI0022475BD9|nr:protein cereblon-like [Mytilus californianus]